MSIPDTYSDTYSKIYDLNILYAFGINPIMNYPDLVISGLMPYIITDAGSMFLSPLFKS